MSFEFGRFIIHSIRPEILASFFSEVFDIALIEKDDSLSLADASFLPFDFKKSPKKMKTADKYHLFVDDLSDIEELKQKISFFCYRHQLKDKLFKITENNNSLTITDIDGREWLFSQKQ